MHTALKTQEVHFWKSHHYCHDVLKQAAWFAGLCGNNPNPLTIDEIKQKAESGKSYSWAFNIIKNGLDKNSSGASSSLSFSNFDEALKFAITKLPVLGKPLNELTLAELELNRKNKEWILGVRTTFNKFNKWINVDREFVSILEFIKFIQNHKSDYQISSYYCYQLQ
jgi:hypothetical protein